MSPSADSQTIAKIEQLLKDPIAGPKLMAIVNNEQNPGVASNLANIASAVSKQSTPSGQLGAGIGGALGMGLSSLLRKKPASSQTGGPGGPNIPGVESLGRVGPDGYGSGDDNSISGGYYPGDDDISGEDTLEVRRGGKIGGKRRFAAGGEAEDLVEPAAKKPVLTRRPVLSTTIVIAKKPEKKEKPEKKRAGGAIKRKAAAGPPAPFAKGGHVQAPRGYGCAERGKQFRGIY